MWLSVFICSAKIKWNDFGFVSVWALFFSFFPSLFLFPVIDPTYELANKSSCVYEIAASFKFCSFMGIELNLVCLVRMLLVKCKIIFLQYAMSSSV